MEFANDFAGAIKNRMKSRPIISMSPETGSVSITKHSSSCMYQALVDDILKHRGAGSMCVLTQTNEEAVILVALLRKYNLKSKLIQSMEGFRFWKMAEVRYFLNHIDKNVLLITQQTRQKNCKTLKAHSH